MSRCLTYLRDYGRGTLSPFHGFETFLVRKLRRNICNSKVSHFNLIWHKSLWDYWFLSKFIVQCKRSYSTKYINLRYIKNYKNYFCHLTCYLSWFKEAMWSIYQYSSSHKQKYSGMAYIFSQLSPPAILLFLCCKW